MVAIRQRLTWDSLTPATPIDTGDVVDVLVDGEEPIRGTYCGLHAFPSGRVYAEISIDDHAWQFVCLEIPHTIRLVRESMSLAIDDERDRLDAEDNMRITPRGQNLCVFYCCLGVIVVVSALLAAKCWAAFGNGLLLDLRF